MANLHCLRCDYGSNGEWVSRKENPKKCPHCQNPNWNKPRTRRRRVVLSNDGQAAQSVVLSSAGHAGTLGESAANGDTLNGTGNPVDVGSTPTLSTNIDRIKQARERAEKLLEGLL